MLINTLIWIIPLLIASGCSSNDKNLSTNSIEEGEIRINLIILVDGKLLSYEGGSTTNSFWILYQKDQESTRIPFRHSPGQLVFSFESYQEMMDASVDSVYLQMNYTYWNVPEDCEEKEYYSDEEIDNLGVFQHVDCDLFEFHSKFDRKWLDRHYVVMEIFHTKRSRYGDVYHSLPERDYTFEVNSGKYNLDYRESFIELKN